MRGDKAEKLANEAKKAGRESAAEWPIPAGGFAGLEDNYFLTVLLPHKAAAARVVPFAHKDQAGKAFSEVAVALAGSRETEFKAYFGPKDPHALSRQKLRLQRAAALAGILF